MAVVTLAKIENLAKLMQCVRGAKATIKHVPTWMANQSLQLKTERDTAAGLLQADPDLVGPAVKADLVQFAQIVNRVCAVLDAAQADVLAAVEAEAPNLD